MSVPEMLCVAALLAQGGADVPRPTVTLSSARSKPAKVWITVENTSTRPIEFSATAHEALASLVVEDAGGGPSRATRRALRGGGPRRPPLLPGESLTKTI